VRLHAREGLVEVAHDLVDADDDDGLGRPVAERGDPVARAVYVDYLALQRYGVGARYEQVAGQLPLEYGGLGVLREARGVMVQELAARVGRLPLDTQVPDGHGTAEADGRALLQVFGHEFRRLGARLDVDGVEPVLLERPGGRFADGVAPPRSYCIHMSPPRMILRVV